MSSSWSLETKKLPLKVKWSIARGSTTEKENIFIKFKDDYLEGVGEVAFLTQGELTVDAVKDHFDTFLSSKPVLINGLDDLTKVLGEIEIPSSLRYAIESAYTHYLAQVMGSTCQRVLGVREVSKILTSHSVPHMEIGEVEDHLSRGNLSRFHCLKIKVKKFEDFELVREVGRLYEGKIRIDGNECFSEAKEVLEFINSLSGLPIEFLEQPLPADAFEESILLRERSKVMLIGDESIQAGPIVDEYQKMFHGVNIKLSKSGGYITALKQLREARLLGLKTMLGCMIETSLGISCAMNIGYGVDYFDLDGFLFLKDDPYSLVYEDGGVLYYSHSL